MNQSNLSLPTASSLKLTTSNSIFKYICIFIISSGIFTNLLSIFTFLSLKFNNSSYVYMFLNSITNFVYLSLALISTFLPIYQATWFTTIYEILIEIYFMSSLTMFRLMTSIAFTFDTYCTLSNKRWFHKISNISILGLLFIFSLIYYGQEPFSYQIIATPINCVNGSFNYSSELNDFGKLQIVKLIRNFENIVHFILNVGVLSLLNILNLIVFVKKYKRIEIKQQILSRNSACSVTPIVIGDIYEKKVKKMMNKKDAKSRTIIVILISLSNVIGSAPSTLATIVSSQTNLFIIGTQMTSMYVMVPRLFHVLLPTLDIFVYFFYNKKFKNVLKKFISKEKNSF